jgi:invasion protein IalB
MLKLIPLAALALAVPAVAQQAAPPAQAKPARDPNRMICEKQEDIGSRLATKKVCKTAAAWAEERRLQREGLEKSQQMGTGMPAR